MQKHFYLILTSLLFIFSTAQAKTEDWYWTFGLGPSFPTYPSSLQTAIDNAKAQGVDSKAPIALDLGFYWPVEPNTIIGPSIHGSSQRFSGPLADTSITQSGLYFSAMHTIGSEPGSGFILRGDIGIASVGAEVGSGNFAVKQTNSGFGVNAGIGYGFNVSDETRLIFLGVYSYRHVASENYSDFTITFGPMF